MNIKLYQVNMDRDEDSVAFLSLDNLRHTHPNAEVDPAIYDLVYSGEVNCKDLEEVFHLFNFDHPADFTGRSMSVRESAASRERDCRSHLPKREPYSG